MLQQFRTSDAGSVPLEYALIALLISVAVLGGLTSLQGSVTQLYDRLSPIIAAMH
jgi:Flp pilus assembly pilin Flp